MAVSSRPLTPHDQPVAQTHQYPPLHHQITSPAVYIFFKSASCHPSHEYGLVTLRFAGAAATLHQIRWADDIFVSCLSPNSSIFVCWHLHITSMSRMFQVVIEKCHLDGNSNTQLLLLAPLILHFVCGSGEGNG